MKSLLEATPSSPDQRTRRRLLQMSLAGGAMLLAGRGARAQVTDINDAINKAGRQRMLSQRMAKAWLAVGQGVDTGRAQRILADSVTLFERQHGELVTYAPNAEIRAIYGALAPAWSEYKAALTGGTPSLSAASALLSLDARVLQLAHQGTVLLEKHSGRSVAHLVNLAGRQRMLSQRMAKFYLAQAWQVQIMDAGKELDTARAEFVQALKVLREAPEATPAIRDELRLAEQQWVFFDNALHRASNGGGTSQHAGEVFRSSENILQAMDRVTGLYARISA